MRGDAAPACVYVPDLPEPGGSGWLAGDERHHVVTVCRAAAGDTATATDGAGRRATIRLTSLGTRVAFQVEAVEVVPRARTLRIACGAPEGTRADWLIEKLAELGTASLQPLDCARGRWRWSPSRAARSERLTIAALKQSCAAHRMRVEPPAGLTAWLESLEPGGTRWLADPQGGPPPAGAADGTLLAASGPASGFTPGELAALEASGFIAVRLAADVLRAETAGLALAALWAATGVQAARADRRPT